MKIVIPGIPVAQARMKHSNRGGFVRVYDPIAKEKKKIRCMLQNQAIDYVFQHPIISFLFHMPIPKSIKKKEWDMYHSGMLKHVKKPDVDNLVKNFLDCLDGIFIQGDQRVSLGPCVKVYHPEPKTIIWIQESMPVLEDWVFPHQYVSEP